MLFLIFQILPSPNKLSSILKLERTGTIVRSPLISVGISFRENGLEEGSKIFVLRGIPKKGIKEESDPSPTQFVFAPKKPNRPWLI